MQIITKMGSGTILKNKKFCKDQKQFFFYRDQNLNGSYLQGRVQYLSQKKKLWFRNIEFFFLNHITFSFVVIQREKNEDSCRLSTFWDLLDIISKMLDLDELFQFGNVCKNWWQFHKIYWRNFMASQKPLLVQMSSISKKSFSFINLAHQKVYHSKMLNNFFRFTYQGSSSGYFIMTRRNNSFILINPFKRKKRKIINSTFEVDFSCFVCRVLLAFVRGSKEFIFVVLCRNNLYVYKSQNFGWVTYSRSQKVVDFAVLHNTIYVVTDKANIGILSLSSTNISFLELNSSPGVTFTPYSHVRLVSCDGHLLVLNFMSKVVFDAYKIDFSNMDYVKLETLGDLALFHAPGRNYYALSNPELWGYEKNYVYVIDLPYHKYRVYKGDGNKMPKLVLPFLIADYPRTYSYTEQPYLDWYFRHQHYEVDYPFV